MNNKKEAIRDKRTVYRLLWFISKKRDRGSSQELRCYRKWKCRDVGLKKKTSEVSPIRIRLDPKNR